MTDNIEFLKKEQRRKLSEKRKFLQNKINLNNNIFYEKLLLYSWFKSSKIIASFLSIKTEIPTLLFNEFIEKQNKILCITVISKKIGECLTFKSYSKGDDLYMGKFNVKEPKNNKIYLPDIIFTPCLGFDLSGSRLGYGGGYYDKTIAYLKSINHNFYIIGLAYDDQKVEKIYTDIYDQKLNYILTEKQLYKIS